jgi:serine/threonine-protein kinase
MGTKLRPGDPDLLPRTFAGRYELFELIASGGMADVYKARDSLLDRDVAIKVLPDHLSSDPSFVSRFQREARSAARLIHPNIVSLFDYGSDGGTSFIVMEYVEGRTVCDTLEDTPRLSPLRAAQVAIGVTRALARAHTAGVIHRDITSSNVMITAQETKVADFGISHTLTTDDQVTTARDGVIVGTAAYLSPEQARGLPADPRSDIYSLGIVLYEMLTGKVPFQGESSFATAYLHITDRPVPPSLLNSDVPASLEAIVLRALAKDPGDRYASALDMERDLERFISGDRVNATMMIEPAPEQRWIEITPRRETRKKNIFRRLAPIAVIASIALIVYSGISMERVSSVPEVPELEGRVLEDALARLEPLGVRIRTVDEYSSRPEGVVLGQEPAAGTSISAGETVILTVSVGPEPSLLDQLEDGLGDAFDGLGSGIERGLDDFDFFLD